MMHIDCSGSNYAMGQQYGEAAREAIHHNLAMWRSDELVRKYRDELMREAVMLRRVVPDVVDEMQGTAEAVNVSILHIILMNQRSADLPGVGCTPIAIGDGENGPLIGKNNDRPLGETGKFIIRRSFPITGIPMIQVTYAGWFSGLDAMNANGLANAHASVGSRFDQTIGSPDARLWSYRLMRECSDTSAFVAAMCERRLVGKGFNILVVDAQGKMCVIEAALPKVLLRGMTDRVIFATNHYNCDPLFDADQRSMSAKQHSLLRYEALQCMVRDHPPDSVTAFQSLLHCREPWAPFRTGTDGSETAWSMVVICRERAVLINEADREAGCARVNF